MYMGGTWEAYGKHMGTCRRCMGGIQEASKNTQGWEGLCGGVYGNIWEAKGNHMGGIWGIYGVHMGWHKGGQGGQKGYPKGGSRGSNFWSPGWKYSTLLVTNLYV